MVIARTESLAPWNGLKLRSTEPSEFRRARWLRPTPLTKVKSPPMRTLPLDWRAMAKTEPLAPRPGSKEASSDPLSLRRQKKLRGVVLNEVKAPPTRSFRDVPMNDSATAKTSLSGPVPGLKVVSRAALLARRAKWVRAVLLTLVKVPPIRIRWSVWLRTVRTEASAPARGEVEEKDWSREPSALRRAMRLRETALAVVKSPTATSFPSGWRAMARTASLKPAEGSWAVSRPPGGSLKLSSSMMLMMAVLGEPREPTGEALVRLRVIKRGRSSTALSRMGTAKVLLTSPGPKEKAPLVGMKSIPGEAEPGRVAKFTVMDSELPPVRTTVMNAGPPFSLAL